MTLFLNPIEEAFSTSAVIKSRLNDQDVRHDLLDAHHGHIEKNVNLQSYRLQILGVARTLLEHREMVNEEETCLYFLVHRYFLWHQIA